jgi:murein DD-endopeptidase MepM/ murein hydrolase activator NlpD
VRLVAIAARLRHAPGILAILGVIAALQVSTAAALNSSPCPGGSTASGARVWPPPACPTPDPNQALYDQLRQRLGGDLARALTTQQHLAALLSQTASSEQILTTQISQEEARITDLQGQVATLDAQIADTQSRIDVEKAQLGALVRALYRQPDSLWILIARTGNVRDALLASGDLVIAGERAHALQAQLESDLTQQQSNRDARQADLDRENSVRDSLMSSLSSLTDLMNQQNDVTNQMAELITKIRDLENGVQNQPPDVAASLAALLEQQEQDLIAKAYQEAWNQATVGSGLAMMTFELPADQTLAGLTISWPIYGAKITQRFGPTSFVLEPPHGGYAHFHTGVDLAAVMGTPVVAAAPGIVVAVGHSGVGYGNYVVVAHGGGIMTLYGHLLETDVAVGDKVARGERVGREGSTGWSTGPHLHFEVRVGNEPVDPMRYLPPIAPA